MPEPCPVCGGACEKTWTEVAGGGFQYQATVTPAQLALALDNESVARRVAAMMPPKLRLALASVLLEGNGQDAYFTIGDVRDEAEAGARCLKVAKELSDRRQLKEAAEFRDMAERHQRRALRIGSLLPTAEQAAIHQQIYGSPLADPPRTPIEIVKS